MSANTFGSTSPLSWACRLSIYGLRTVAAALTSLTQIEMETRMKIRPLHDRVIVKRIEEERKTASGIVIPDTAAEKPDQGEIVAVGKGKKNDDGKVSPLDVKVGDRVLFGKYSGNDIKIDDEEFMILKEDEILAKLAPNAKAAGGKK